MKNNSDNTSDSSDSFEHRYKTLLAAFDNSEPSFIIEQDGTILEANKAFAAIFGKQVHEVINRNVFDLLSPQLAARCREKVAEAFLTGKRVIFEDNRDGLFIRHTIYPFPDSDGTITRFYITGQDITELKMSKNDAQKFHIVSSLLIEQIPSAFFMLDAKGRYVEWNAYQRDVVIGKSESEMSSTFGFETVHPDDRALAEERFKYVMETGNEDSREFRILIHGGPEFCWHKLTAIKIQINGIPYLIGIGTDFTAQKLAADIALMESEKRFKTLFAEHSAVKLVLEAATADIINTNQAAADFYGWTIEELCTMNLRDINTTPPEQAISEIQKHRISTKLPFAFQHRMADNSLRDIEAFITKINVEGKELFYAIIHDVTLQKQMQGELVAAKEKAENADRLKSAFLATITHELRTPMNGILCLTELLKSPELSPEESTEYTDLIHISGQRLLSLINELIDTARIESGETRIQQDDTDINKLLHDLTAFFRLEMQKKGLLLKSTTGLTDSESTIRTDSAKLTQILTNLVNNALKFTLKGGIEIGYTKVNGTLEFYVKDTGIGIPSAMHEKIFERFIQVDNPLTKGMEGSGLGLSITRAYVTMLGGTIRIDSVEGKGSTFTFTLPYNPPDSIEPCK